MTTPAATPTAIQILFINPSEVVDCLPMTRCGQRRAMLLALRPFRGGLLSGAGQRRSQSAARFGVQQGFDVGILIKYTRGVLKKSAGVSRWTISAVKLVSDRSKVCRQLAAMMRGVRESPDQYPGAVPIDVEKSSGFFEPLIRHCLQLSQSPLGRRSVFLHELVSGFDWGQRR